ncbi:hypothetical protein K0T92_07330 [Paenibacillus oenotherae]|uniref:Uncharacterized protein n=1 Tax=Paenibacillus oenotherae TaxID=1435645 RepID=A0ABS7D3Z4_9BACL|nr:hypothetical protein [Paenibacillus oenotherae]MBW7474553.1 hypothetical protein [Paenibacillus oenotherae]
MVKASGDEAAQSGLNNEGLAVKRRGRPPGSLKSSAEAAQEQEPEAQEEIGPEGAAPHWQAFYRSIRDAVADMRPPRG